jgi:hypothetical protein
MMGFASAFALMRFGGTGRSTDPTDLQQHRAIAPYRPADIGA